MCVCWYRGAGCWNSGFSGQTWLGERTGVDCVETAWRCWSMAQATIGGVHRTEPQSTIEAPLLTPMWWKRWGPTIAASFSPCSQWVPICLYRQEPAVAHTRKQGWNPSKSPWTVQLQKPGWNLSPVQWLCDFGGFTPLCELSACGTSEQITSAPVAGTGPELAAAGFMGACTRRHVLSLGWFHSSHGRSKCANMHDYGGSWCLTLVYLC